MIRAAGKRTGDLRARKVRRRTEQAYLDKLDGKITEVFWAAKSSEWNQEEQQILMALAGLEQQSPEKLLDGARILELANKAYFLYLRQPPAEKAKLLQIVLSNCKIDAASIEPTYRKPFDLVFRRVKNEGWLPELYDLRAFRFECPRNPSGIRRVHKC